MTFIATIDCKADIVSVNADNIDDAVIGIKTLVAVGDVISMTFLEVLVIEIAEIVIDN